VRDSYNTILLGIFPGHKNKHGNIESKMSCRTYDQIDRSRARKSDAMLDAPSSIPRQVLEFSLLGKAALPFGATAQQKTKK
jgi:hypothetical protein